jgi:hypothetical protein
MINMKSQKMNNCRNQDLQDYRISGIGRIDEKSPKDFNIDNLLQVQRSKESAGYREQGTRNKGESTKGRMSEGSKQQTKPCLLVHSFTCPLINNHLNNINHSSDKRGRKDEGTKGRKEEAFPCILFHRGLLACCLLLAACCQLACRLIDKVKNKVIIYIVKIKLIINKN